MDTEIYVMDAASCYLGDADDSFECSYSPAEGSCPSYVLPVMQGDEYLILVHSFGHCESSTGEYKLMIDKTGNPALALVASEQPYFAFQRIHVEGSAHIPVSGSSRSRQRKTVPQSSIARPKYVRNQSRVADLSPVLNKTPPMPVTLLTAHPAVARWVSLRG